MQKQKGMAMKTGDFDVLEEISIVSDTHHNYEMILL